MKTAKNVMTVKAYSQPGDASTIAEYVVSGTPSAIQVLVFTLIRPDILLALCLEYYQRISFWTGRDGSRLQPLLGKARESRRR